MSVTTMGDLLLDVIVHVEGPIAIDTDTFGEIAVGAGGQAANVAAWVAALGRRSRLICVRCADAAGMLIATELARRNVELVGPKEDGKTGTVVSLPRADGTRSMLSDRGAAATLTAAAFESSWLEGFDWLHISGYSLASEPLRTAALRAAATQQAAGAQVSLDLASTTVIDAVGGARFTELLAELRPTVVFATEAERESIERGSEPGGFARGTWVIKRGAAGFTVLDRAGTRDFAAAPTTVIDPTGAGDALAAGYLVGGVELARESAARCLAKSGAMP